MDWECTGGGKRGSGIVSFSVDQIQQILNFPQPIRQSRLHGRGRADRRVNPAIVVIRPENRGHVLMVLNFFRESVGQSSIAPHPHADGEVGPFDKAGADVL